MTRIPLAGVDAVRHSALIVRDGEHLLPAIAAAISSVRTVSAQRWGDLRFPTPDPSAPDSEEAATP